jgi:hypothetical protein
MKRVIGLRRWGQWELRLEEERLGRIWGGYKTVRAASLVTRCAHGNL